MLSRYRFQALIAAAGLVVIAAALVLYGMMSGSVHGGGATPPAVLADLKPVTPAKTVPAVAFSAADGSRHMLSEFKGRYVLLNLWATWCAPCVKELPALAALQKAVSKDQLVVVPVNVGRSDAKKTGQFLKKHGAGSLPVYNDTNIALVRAFRAYGLPASILIDPQGREIARAMGPAEWDAPAAITYFKNLPLAPKPAS